MSSYNHNLLGQISGGFFQTLIAVFFVCFQDEEIVKPKQAKKRKKVMSDSD